MTMLADVVIMGAELLENRPLLKHRKISTRLHDNRKVYVLFGLESN